MTIEPNEGPRERLRRVGIEGLSDQELIALLLGTGAPGEPVMVVASRLLHEAGGLRGIGRLGLGSLERLTGLGPTKGARLLAALELGRRSLARPFERSVRFTSSAMVDAALRPRLATAQSERFLAIALDVKQRLIAEIEIGRGGMTACPVDPGDVFRALLREAAVGAIFVHNHPSGDPQPSVDDVQLTDRLTRAGSLLGIHVLDHVIVAAQGHFSFADAGLLPTSP